MRRKVIASILCLVFLFTVSGMALGAPQNGLYVNGHRYELTLSKTDAAYLLFLADLKAVAWDWSKVIIVNENQFAGYQDAVDEGSIDDVLQEGADAQVGQALPTTVIPIANNGDPGAPENVDGTPIEDTVYESTNALANTAVSVPNGTAEADARALLDAAVGVVGTKGETGSASITWSIASYNATVAGDYTATGVLTLPAGWTGSANDVTAKVTVQDVIPPAYESTNALATPVVSVANGTTEADALALLDAAVGVVGTKGETGSAAIAWTINGYDAAAAGDYTANGVLTLPAGWTGTVNDVTATVTVEAPLPPAYASTAALTTTTVTVENGTAEAAAIAQLDKTVVVIGTLGEIGSADIAWTIANYDANTAGNYTATGVLTLPGDWTGTAPNVSATVTVEEPLPPAYASTAALTTTTVTVENGTAEAAAIAQLQTSVGVTSTKGETGTASIAWTIAAYNANTAGDYTATGVLTLPEDWTGAAPNVTATVTVEAPAGFSTAVQVIDNAIDNFQPVNGTGKFTGKITGVKAVKDGTAYVDYLEATSASIDANKNESITYKAYIWAKLGILTVKVVNGTNTHAAFPFAEIISGSGDGSSLVTNGTLSESKDGKYYEIQLVDVDCPDSIMKILNSTNEISGSYSFVFHKHKLTAKIKVSTTTGLVESVEGIIIKGTMDLSGSTGGAADGTNYPTEFVCDKITMNYQ